ncbi:MAG: FMN-dependent NADH-azoreductase [Bacilli bacterium]
MTTLLYVKAHPLTAEHSFSLSAGEAFLAAYREANPTHDIQEIDLFNVDVPEIDAEVFAAWGALGAGAAFDTLAPTAQQKVARMNELLEQFIAADKYVFVSPMWNFLFPPVLKAYIDTVVMAGKTFAYTAEGPAGLLKDKKALHIQASGSVFSEGPYAGAEMAHNYLKGVLGFIGVSDVSKLFVEGQGQFPDRAAEIKANGVAAAAELGSTF